MTNSRGPVTISWAEVDECAYKLPVRIRWLIEESPVYFGPVQFVDAVTRGYSENVMIMQVVDTIIARTLDVYGPDHPQAQPEYAKKLLQKALHVNRVFWNNSVPKRAKIR